MILHKRRASLVLAVTTMCACHSQAFAPMSTPPAFVRNTPLHHHTTRHLDEWELPEDVPSDRSSSRQRHETTSFTEARRLRLEREASLESKFVTGDDLYHLRTHAMTLRQELKDARSLGATHRVHELERAILKVQQVDAEFVYAVNLERMNAAEANGHAERAQVYRQLAMEARSALPQFNLDGLWVGKYGDDCYEMINVTYVGDTLYAYKVTGHSSVPSGEISFTSNLSPFATAQDELLEPIQLGEDASDQWGIQYLQRYKGEGQVASEGFVNPQFVDGQLIMVNEYFSFAWVPLGHQVFFGRPSAELTLKMLKDFEEPQSEVEKSRAHLERCMEETEIMEEEWEQDDQAHYAPQQQDYYHMEGCFE